MVYIYRKVLVSATTEGIEGVSSGMASISTFMQDCGWNLVEDRSSEPGTGQDATHMKYVFSSNGEEGNYPTFYMTLYSGSSSAANTDLMFAVTHTAYDTGTHLTPASGVRTGNGTLVTDVNADNRLQIKSQSDDTEIYMAGDSEMVHLITRKTIDNNSINTMDNIFFGRFNSFFSVEDNPYPLIIQADQTLSITVATSTFPRAVWSNPPQSSAARAHVSTNSPSTLFDANQPYNLGVTSIFTALPIVIYYLSVPGDIVQSVAGTVRNGWISADGSSLLNLSILTASGSGGAQEYISFTKENSLTTPSLIVRKS